MSCCKITSVCLSFAAKCWRCFTNALMTLRHYAFSRQHRTQFSEDVYAFVLWRYVAVQIWHVTELFVPGFVASTINVKQKWNIQWTKHWNKQKFRMGGGGRKQNWYQHYFFLSCKSIAQFLITMSSPEPSFVVISVCLDRLCKTGIVCTLSSLSDIFKCCSILGHMTITCSKL